MAETQFIRVPEEVRKMLNRTHEEMGRDVRLYAALMLFHLGMLSSGAAANMAGVPRMMFLDHCAENGIPISQITGAELAGEIDAG